MVALDGKALSWFQWWETCNSDIGWGDFKVVILERFQTSATLNPFAALLALKQEETVEEYIEQFERSTGGVSTDPQKLEAMTLWPMPKNVTGLRGFLGLTGYNKRFVHNYGKIARPLTNLLKKNAFQWSSEAQTAFEQLKQAMTSLPTLAVPDFSKPFVVETDACGTRFRVVLMQEGRPLAFWNTTISERNQRKSVYDREFMAVVKVVQKWRHYLLGNHFIIKTDQKSLKFLIEHRKLGEEQYKWIFKWEGYDFEIQYKPGKENSATDGLSKRSSYCAMTVLQIHDFEEWTEEIIQDDKL